VVDEDVDFVRHERLGDDGRCRIERRPKLKRLDAEQPLQHEQQPIILGSPVIVA
jgi:hypothetical protein